MEIRGRLAELIVHARELNEDGDCEPLQLFVEDVPVITGSTSAIICNEAEDEASPWAPHERYRYVLMLRQVQAVLERWCEQQGRPPTVDEACRAILFFSENDRHIPAECAPPSTPFVWPVLHPRGEG